ncbi:hypothetical protein, partial [Spirosoma daeguense]
GCKGWELWLFKDVAFSSISPHGRWVNPTSRKAYLRLPCDSGHVPKVGCSARWAASGRHEKCQN